MDRDAWISLGKGTGTDFAVGLEAGWGRSRRDQVGRGRDEGREHGERQLELEEI